MIRVFIDGSEGTTGLRIYERFENRADVELLRIDPERRKDAGARREMINSADIAFLCLPDGAARESASLAGDRVRLIDTSTAHRTEAGWSYGFPELSAAHRAAIRDGKRIAVPGCHASGFVALAYPLVKEGLVAPGAALSCFSLTGYSGGGKKMIAEYQGEGREPSLDSPRVYGLSQEHKHLKEMKAIPGLDTAPLFSPIVADYYSGMLTCVPLHGALLPKGMGASALQAFYADYYGGQPFMEVLPLQDAGMLPSNSLLGYDGMEIIVSGNDARILVSARFDNLGKGASGAAVQCMNLMLGLDETRGLNLRKA